MIPARTCTTLGAAVAGAALLTSASAIWLVLNDPASLAYAVSERGVQGLVQAIAELIIDAVAHVIGRLSV